MLRGERTPRASDVAPWLAPQPTTARVRSTRRSFHLPMRDGVRIAIDVHLPAEPRAGRLPAIIRQTRYFRSVAFRRLVEPLPLEWLLNSSALTRDRFVANGYAWIDVCARGSGASFGNRPCPWSPEEVADGAEVVSWIIAQDWSNGSVGATGISYDGTTAEMLAVNQHPAVKAIIPRFSCYDVFADVAFPGGIHLAGFTAKWAGFNRDLDENALDRAFARMIRVQIGALRELVNGAGGVRSQLLALADSDPGEQLAALALRLLARGVRPVDNDGDELLRAAVASHRGNLDVHQGALSIDFRDDAGMSPGYPDADIDLFSPHAHAVALQNSGAAIYGYSGWLDGAYQNSAVKRFRQIRTAGSRLLLGPWDHGGRQQVSPFCAERLSGFDHDSEMLNFFDLHLRGRDNAMRDAPPVRYFTCGEERWHSAEDWPPPADMTPWHLAPGHRLEREPPGAQGADDYRIDDAVGSGRRARWMSLLGLLPPVGYNDRRALDGRLLLYRSQPLAADLRVTGHPRLELTLTCSHDDTFLFAYLEVERPDGCVEYVTEGQLRALHRHHTLTQDGLVERSYRRADAAPLTPGEPTELVVEMLPMSWLIPRGWRLRLALAGADRDHFEPPPHRATLAVHHGPQRGSRLILPVVPSR